jgi:RHS repeat-associated protein
MSYFATFFRLRRQESVAIASGEGAMKRSLKQVAVLLVVTTLTCLHAAHGQQCYTPVTSWQVNYSLSGSGTGACADGQSGATCTTNETATGTDSYTMGVASCSSLQWGPTDSGTVTSASVNDMEQYQCQANPPIQETETVVGSGGAAGPAFGQTFFTINVSNGTYSFEPFPYGNATETEQGCFKTTGSAPYPLYPSTNWPQTFTLPTSLEPLDVSNFGFQGGGGLNVTVPWNFSFTLTPTVDCDQCKQNGGQGMPLASSISTENGSLGEDLPVAGTEFTLHYESGRAPGAAGIAVAIADASMIGGWTLNVHQAYDSGSNTLLLGNGTQRNGYELGNLLVVNNQALFTSEDGGEIYAFSLTTGKHVQTLRPMTGALIYQFGYDAAGNLITITDASGNVTTIQRDASEHPTAIVAPFGQTTILSVDANGFLSQVTDPLGKPVGLVNSANGLLTSRTDANGNVFNYTYDANGRLSKDADPLGGFVSLTRTNSGSGLGWTVGETTSTGRASNYQTTMTLPWTLSNTSTVNEQHTNTWPNRLQATSNTQLQSGQLIKTMALPDGTATSETLGPDPRWGLQAPVPISGTDKLGNLTTTKTGSRTATLGTSGNPFSLTTQTDTQTINGRTYKSVFTTSTKTYVDTTPVKRTTTTVLDSLERPVSVQVGALLPLTFGYDSHGRVSTITQSTRKTTLTYDSNGFLATDTDPLGFTTSFTHDADGRLLTTTLADGRVITYSYDGNGNVTSVTPPGKSAHDFSYNAVDLPLIYTPPIVSGTGATSYSYNTDRDLTTITRPDSQTITFGYDSAGRLSSTATPSETINYSYDATTGNLTGAAVSGGESVAYGYNGPLPISSALTGTVAGTVSRTFNNNFWVASQSLNSANTVNFTHDNDGLLTKAGTLTVKRDSKVGFVTGTTLGVISDSFRYNTFGDFVGYTAKSVVGAVTATLDTVAYTRDAGGRISTVTETIGGAKTTYNYIYDAARRLTTVKKNGATTSTYSYDTNSNRLKATTSTGTVAGTYDAQDRLLTYGNASYTYTANGELASQIVSSQTTSYTYDVLGNLTAVTLPSGNKITYLIDAENHRVGKAVNGALQTGFLYDGDRIVAQLNASNQIVSQFVYATNSASPDYMVTGGVIYRIVTDQLGSPRLVVNTTTGAIAERIDYDEFGNVLKDTDPGFQPFGFGGGLYDQDTRLVRFGARDYNASIGRWTVKDPILFDGGDTNVYGYVLNDPVNEIDPSGLQGTSCTSCAQKCTCAQKKQKPKYKIHRGKYGVPTRQDVVYLPPGWGKGVPLPERYHCHREKHVLYVTLRRPSRRPRRDSSIGSKIRAASADLAIGVAHVTSAVIGTKPSPGRARSQESGQELT